MRALAAATNRGSFSLRNGSGALVHSARRGAGARGRTDAEARARRAASITAPLLAAAATSVSRQG